MKTINFAASILLIIGVIGCDDSKVKSLQSENDTLKSQIDDLQKQIQEKDIEIQTLREPDKIAFQKVEDDWIAMGGVYLSMKQPPVKTEDIAALIQKYFNFSIHYSTSPFVQNAEKRIADLKKEIERQNIISEREKKFLSVPLVDTSELADHAEQYLGKEVRLETTIHNAIAGSCYFDGAIGLKVSATVIRESHESHASFPGRFIVRIERDEDARPCAVILDYD